MKFSAAVLLLAVSGQFVAGFSPLQIPSRTSTGASRQFTSTTRIYSQWDDEEDDTKAATSFEDAGVQLKEDDDQKAMDAAPDYDANPAVSSIQKVGLHGLTEQMRLFLFP